MLQKLHEYFAASHVGTVRYYFTQQVELVRMLFEFFQKSLQ